MSEFRDDVKAHIHSGEPGTSGREPFEDKIATGPGQAYSSDNTSGDGRGAMSSTTIPGQGQGRGQSGHHGHRHGEGEECFEGGNEQGQHHGTHGTGAGVGGLAAGAGAAAVGSHQHGHEHHQHGQGGQGIGSGVGALGQSGAGRIDEDTRGTGATGIHRGQHEGGHYGADENAARSGNNDRVGDLNQGGAMYERTGAGGPVTGGAAGTDRFDSDRNRSGAGIGGTGQAAQGGYGGPNDINESTTRAEGKGTGGIGGILGTTDKDFTGRDRLGQGAYHDDQGLFKSNTHGPGGSALTGREGDLSKNPVAQAEGRTGAGVGSTGATTGTHGGVGHEDEQHKKGIVEKIKDAIL